MLRDYIVKRQSEEIVVRSKMKNGEWKTSRTGKFPGNDTLPLLSG
jgi:hypothetical protein